MVAVTLGLAPYAGWLYTACALGLGGWFLAEAHGLHARVAAMPDPRTSPLPITVPAGPAPAALPDGPAPAPAAADAARVTEGACAGLARPSANPAPMRLFHLSIAYLTLLFAVIAVTALLPWGTW
jgi:heme O synthase-like polyprenyltransferase